MIVIEGIEEPEVALEGLVTKSLFEANNNRKRNVEQLVTHAVFKSDTMVPVCSIELPALSLAIDSLNNDLGLSEHFLVRKYLSDWAINPIYKKFAKLCIEKESYGLLMSLDHNKLSSIQGNENEVKAEIIKQVDSFISNCTVNLTASAYGTHIQRPTVAYSAAIDYANSTMSWTKGGSRIAIEGYNKLETNWLYMNAIDSGENTYMPLFVVRIKKSSISKFKLALITNTGYPVEDMEISVNSVLNTAPLVRIKKSIYNTIFKSLQDMGIEIKTYDNLASEIYNFSSLLKPTKSLVENSKLRSDFIKNMTPEIVQTIINTGISIENRTKYRSKIFEQENVNKAEIEEIINNIFEEII